jgi:cyclic pyranopterin phosphate synthase
MKDSFDREINYLRVSLTDRCNLRCKYCMPEKGIDKLKHDDILSLEEIYELIEIFVQLGITKIRFTGGEPLIRHGVIDLIERVSKLNGIRELTMTTNGTLIKDNIAGLKNAGLNRLNISLDTLDEKKYKSITGGGNIFSVLEGIEEAQKMRLTPIKINTVLIGGFNDDEIEDFINLTIDNDIEARFIELMPIGEVADFAKDNFISNNKVLKSAKELIALECEDKSSPAVYYKLPNAIGKIGLISPISCKFCKNCNRVRLTSTGKLKLCLHSDREIDLRSALAEGKDVKKIIMESILIKEEEHHLEYEKYIYKNMNQIGG